MKLFKKNLSKSHLPSMRCAWRGDNDWHKYTCIYTHL